MAFMGIDPGQKGGIAYIGEETSFVYPFSKESLLVASEYAKLHPITICALETVHAFPGQGVVSMFNFGVSYGYIQGVLDAYRIPFHRVSPQNWKKHFGLIGKDKQASIEKAHELFPGISLQSSKRCKKESDGMAEALLIAEYARYEQERCYS